jgi:transcriptional regulator with XRE-family HTH domain
MRWSTRAFSEHVGISLGTLYELEHAKYQTVSVDTLERLAKGFGVHVSTLLREPRSKRDAPDGLSARELAAHHVLRLRTRRGWTQEKLAAMSQVHRSVIAGIESRRRNVSLAVLEKLAPALQVSLSDLISARDALLDR